MSLTTRPPLRVNCNASFRYQVRVRVPNDAGELGVPSPGDITGVTMRLSATETGSAIHAALDGLAATPAPGRSDLFYVEVSQALHQAHLLTLGVGASYFAIWSKTGDLDMATRRFLVADRDVL